MPDAPTDDRMPPAIRRTVVAVVALLSLGAAYLIVVRGEALLLDLAAVGRYLGCW
jgi:hypothetical protein